MFHLYAFSVYFTYGLVFQRKNVVTLPEYLQALLSDSSPNYDDVQGETAQYVDSDRKESPFAKERRQLLQLVQSLQENHDKEIDLMETSYR